MRRIVAPTMTAVAVTLFAFATASQSAFAQASISTDRPDFTETTSAVDPGMLQLEGGLTFERGRELDAIALPEMLLRLGLLPRAELRLGVPNQVWSWHDGESDFARDDVSLGMKLDVAPPGSPIGLAVIAAVDFATENTDAKDPVPALVVAWSRELRGASIGGIVGHAWTEGARPGEANRLFPTLSLGVPMGERIGAFLEWSADFADGAEPSHLIHHGYTLPLSPDLQLDVHGGVGLTDSAPDFFVGAGFGLRFSR